MDNTKGERRMLKPKWIKKQSSDPDCYWFEWDTPYGVYHCDMDFGCWLMRTEQDYQGLRICKRNTFEALKRAALNDVKKRNAAVMLFINNKESGKC